MTQVADWVELTASCGRCDRRDSVSVPTVKYAEWRGGGAFEVVFSNLSPQQRDVLIGSDTTRPFPYYLCAMCWDKTFEGEEE
jgi:hypothetical protein